MSRRKARPVKKHILFTELLFPVMIVLLPLIGVWRGVGLADTTVSMLGYLHPEKLSPFWDYGYFYSNLLGHLFSKLPSGNMLVVMNFLCATIPAFSGLIAYFFARKYMEDFVAFLGVWGAMCLGLCPVIILYNYLTYFFMLIAVVLIYQGLVRGKKAYLSIAGFVLAQNVFVRFPNVMEVLFIVVVWYYCLVNCVRAREGLRLTLRCVIGYAVGIVTGFVVILITRGTLAGFFTMIHDVIFISDSSAGYSVSDMIVATIRNYILPYKFEAVMLLMMLAGGVVSHFLGKIRSSKPLLVFKFVCILASLALLIWFGMRELYDFDYNGYTPFNKMAIILITVIWVVLLSVLAKWNGDPNAKVMALMIAMILLITPLGSNNGIYPVINNLLIPLPFLLGWWREWCQRDTRNFWVPTRIGLTIFAMFLLFQANAFKVNFTFGDYDDAESPRNTVVTGLGNIDGMWTRKARVEELQSLRASVDSLCEKEDRILVYGNIAGLYYVLDRDCPTSDYWTVLNTNSAKRLKKDLEKLDADTCPVFILGRNQYLEYTDTTAVMMNETDYEKRMLLWNYVKEHHYRYIDTIGEFVIYAYMGE